MIEQPYQGIRTFCKVGDRAISSHKFAIIGAGIDSSTSFRAGARAAPAAIREASMMLSTGVHACYPVDIKQHTSDLGDINVTNGNTNKMLDQMQSTVSNILAWNKHPVVLGGENTITLGVLRAMHAKHGKVAVLHFDAHSDTNTSHYGEAIGNNTWLYNAINEKLIDPTKTVSVGIRAPMSLTSRSWLAKQGGTSISAREAITLSNASEELAHRIQRIIGDTPCYLSFDVCCLDPAYAPGAGTPVVGGFTTMWVLGCIELLFSINWIGMDCVEVSPLYDYSNITALAAATVCWTYLSMVAHNSTRNLILPLTNEQASYRCTVP